MARIRSIKPGFFRSQPIAALPNDTVRLFFIGLWTYADDDGRGLDDPRLIKAEVFPLDDAKTPAKVDGYMDALAAAGRIKRYEVDGRRYFQVLRWHDHQKVNRPKGSEFPRDPAEPDPEDGTADDVNDHCFISDAALPGMEGVKGLVLVRDTDRDARSSVSEGPPGAGPVDDDPMFNPSVFVEACRILAGWDLDERMMPEVVCEKPGQPPGAVLGPVHDPQRWLETALNRRINRHRAQWQAMGGFDGDAASLAERLRTEPAVFEQLVGGGSDCAACESCGLAAVCERCGAAVSVEGGRLRCGACGHERPLVCLECGSGLVRQFEGPVVYRGRRAETAAEARRFAAEASRPPCPECGDRGGRGFVYDPAAGSIVECPVCTRSKAVGG